MSFFPKGLETLLQDIVPPNDAITSPHVPTTDVPFIAGKGFIYKKDLNKKIVRVWLFGQILPVEKYYPLIVLFHTISKEYTVHMYINSPGGSISAACIILSAMERCQAPIVTHNVGIAYSCGSLILAFGNKIHVEPNSVTMFHNAAAFNNDSVHRLLAQTQHTITIVGDLFLRMQDRGLITSEEIDGIVKRGDEYFISGEDMRKRIVESNLWYEGA